jgi:hypothetical protein
MTEIKEATTPEEANRLLAQGFVLVKVMDKMVYVVGLPKEVAQPSASDNGKEGQFGNATTKDSATLNSLHWKKFKSGGGEWTFFLGPDDSLVPELEPARQFIEKLRNEKEVILEGWNYRISKERFLNRFPTQKTAVK